MLGFERRDEPGRPTALPFGPCKINLHEVGHTFEPKAPQPTIGAGDFCLITNQPIERWVERLARHGVTIEDGPAPRTGAEGR